MEIQWRTPYKIVNGFKNSDPTVNMLISIATNHVYFMITMATMTGATILLSSAIVNHHWKMCCVMLTNHLITQQTWFEVRKFTFSFQKAIISVRLLPT